MSTAASGLQWDPSLDGMTGSTPILTGGVSGGPSGSGFNWGNIDPNLLKSLVGTGGKLLTPAATGDPMLNMFTPEMRDQAMAIMQQYMNGQEGVYGAGGYAPNGINVSQTQKLSPADIKKQAFIQFRMSKGDSQAVATQKANQILNDPNITFKDKKGFVKGIGSGQVEGISIGPNGNLITADKYTPGGIKTGAASDNIKSYLDQLNMQSLQAANGLPAQYAANESRALGVRNAMTPQLLNNVAGMNNLGLTNQEQANVDAIDAYYSKQYGDKFNAAGNAAMGVMNNSGFTSSSLADDIWNDYATKPMAEYGSDVAAKMAAQYNDILNSRTARLNTAQTAGLNTFNTVGATSGINSLFSGNTSGADYGLFTDPQAAALAAQIQQNNISNRQKDQQLYQGAYLKSVDIMPPAPGSPGSSGGGGWWNLLGPVGNIVGQTMDGRKGINWGSVGNSALNSGELALGVATGNPMLIAAGAKGTIGSVANK